MPRQLEFRQNANTISRLQKSGVQVGSDSITLSYLKSCVREEITGGIVTVGSEQSDVQSSLVKRGKVDCDATKMLTAPRQGNDAAEVVFKEFVQAAPKMPAPEFKLYGLCPLFELRGAGQLVVQRLDTPGERLEFTIGSHKLVQTLSLISQMRKYLFLPVKSLYSLARASSDIRNRCECRDLPHAHHRALAHDRP